LTKGLRGPKIIVVPARGPFDSPCGRLQAGRFRSLAVCLVGRVFLCASLACYSVFAEKHAYKTGNSGGFEPACLSDAVEEGLLSVFMHGEGFGD